MWKELSFFSFVDALHISSLYFMRKMGGHFVHNAMKPSITRAIDPSTWRQIKGPHSRLILSTTKKLCVAWSDQAGWERAGCKVPSETRGRQRMETTETVNNVPGVYHWVWKWKPLSQSNFDYNNFKKSLAVSTSLKIIQLLASVAAFLLFLPLWLSRWLQNLHLESQLAS